MPSSSSATHSRNSGFAPAPTMSCDSDIVNPRSGFFPRHRALIALSCSTSRGEACDSGIIWNR